MNVYKNISYYCKLKGISAYRLCKDAGISHSSISDLKSGRCNDMKLSAAARVASVLEFTVDLLVYGSEVADE